MKPPGNENSASLEGQNALRVKVAELLGMGQHVWSKSPGDVPCIGFIPQCQLCMIKTDENGANDLCIMAEFPDYPNDLNACAEFEKGLTITQYDLFALQLNRLCEEDRVLSATATQRCRAFVALHEGKEK